ncbi:MAG: ATP-binding protein [Deltaproteobacteria bacterium]|nr:ATP-binding protein [Deltaproteobacteria bacterium]
MFSRTLQSVLLKRAKQFPVVLVAGPRQSGKTTLCRATFPDHPYRSLEAPDVRREAREDPRGFLRALPNGAVIDEVQNVPELLSYLQGEVDERPAAGRFVLTGSQHFALSETVSQSLAGRVGLCELLPLSVTELAREDRLQDVWGTILYGGYPAIHDRKIDPGDWFSGYVATYVERDVRQILNVTDLVAFETFLALAAARTGQLIDQSRFGADAGVSQPTTRKWLTVLEASYVAFRLPPFFRNLGKRLIKAPKLHFFDSGLLCYLLRIRTPEQLRLHPLRGAIFESWVVSEIGKAYRNAGERADLTFFRDRQGLEIDLVAEMGLDRCAVEIKSGETVPTDAFAGLDAFAALNAATQEGVSFRSALVYGGDVERQRGTVSVLPWFKVGDHPWPGL